MTLAAALQSKRTLAVMVLAISLAAGLVFTLPRLVGASDGPQEGPLPPAPGFAGKLIHISTTAYYNEALLNPNLPSAVQQRQTNQVTEAWIEEASDGRATRFRSITRLPSGSVVQDQLYDQSTRTDTVNYYGWEDTDQACSQLIEIDQPGAAFEVIDDSWFSSNGYRQVDHPAELREANASQGGRSFEYLRDVALPGGLNQLRKIVVTDQDTDQRLGVFVYGVDTGGNQTLVQSSITTRAEVLSDVPAGTFALNALPVCHHNPN